MKTQVRRVLGWALILIAPIVMYASINAVYNQTELNNASKVSYSDAIVLATERYRGDPEIRYEFRATKGDDWFTYTDSLGRKNLWAVVSLQDWDKIESGSRTIRVAYLTADPSVNRPANVGGHYVSDLVGAVAFPIVIFVVGLLWTKENKRTASSRRRRTPGGSSQTAPAKLAPMSGAQVEVDAQNKRHAKLPVTFIVCQVAGALSLLPVLAYVRGGGAREAALRLLPYLNNQSLVWAELAIGVLLLVLGGQALFMSVRSRRNRSTVVR